MTDLVFAAARRALQSGLEAKFFKYSVLDESGERRMSESLHHALQQCCHKCLCLTAFFRRLTDVPPIPYREALSGWKYLVKSCPLGVGREPSEKDLESWFTSAARGQKRVNLDSFFTALGSLAAAYYPGDGGAYYFCNVCTSFYATACFDSLGRAHGMRAQPHAFHAPAGGDASFVRFALNHVTPQRLLDADMREALALLDAVGPRRLLPAAATPAVATSSVSPGRVLTLDELAAPSSFIDEVPMEDSAGPAAPAPSALRRVGSMAAAFSKAASLVAALHTVGDVSPTAKSPPTGVPASLPAPAQSSATVTAPATAASPSRRRQGDAAPVEEAPAAQQVAAVEPPTAAAATEPPPAAALLSALEPLRLEMYAPALSALGAECADDIALLSESELLGAGLKPVHARRLLLQLRANSAAVAPAAAAAVSAVQVAVAPPQATLTASAASESHPSPEAGVHTNEAELSAAPHMVGTQTEAAVSTPDNVPSMDAETAPSTSTATTTAAAAADVEDTWDEYATADGFLYYVNVSAHRARALHYTCPCSRSAPTRITPTTTPAASAPLSQATTGATQWVRPPASATVRTLAARAGLQGAVEAIVEERIEAAQQHAEEVAAKVAAPLRTDTEGWRRAWTSVLTSSPPQRGDTSDERDTAAHMNSSSSVAAEARDAAHAADAHNAAFRAGYLHSRPGSRRASADATGREGSSAADAGVVDPAAWAVPAPRLHHFQAADAGDNNIADANFTVIPATAHRASRRAGAAAARRRNSTAGGSVAGSLVSAARTHVSSRMYPEVFEVLPAMDEVTADVLARSNAVANSRVMGYADPRPDIRPLSLLRGAVGSSSDSDAARVVDAGGGGGLQGKVDSQWASGLRPNLYGASADPNGPRSGGDWQRAWASSGLAPSETTPGYAYRHAAATSQWGRAGTVYDRLLDVRGYTGSHKFRFDSEGRGLGLAGREGSFDYAYMLSRVNTDAAKGAATLPDARDVGPAPPVRSKR